ncbi:MAG: carbon starvation protein A [Planctomycetes bacterium]|nr:carbon starvation protein A [Planctomycetota bacterium]
MRSIAAEARACSHGRALAGPAIPVQLSVLALAFFALLVVGYRLYGRFIARHFVLDDRRRTPAHERADGADFVATPPFYLFAQHFSAIAAAGPIVGPILACKNFGWLPCLVWIALGVVFIGAMHDFSALVASVRHGGVSIAEIARERLGGPAGRAMMAFIWIALVYVIVAFVDITAGTFVSGSEELAGTGATFNPGGAVAAASVLYLLLAALMGVVQRFLAPPLWLLTIVFVPATFGTAWLGTRISDWLLFDQGTWALVILGYCAVASVVPVWALLQPRGYLGGFVLYTALALGLVGVFFGGYEVQQPAFKSFDVGGATGSLFPFLFVTIACGACSGFHGLVCSGTTSKQIDRESHAHFVGYGAMLAEGFVALIALVTIMMLSPAEVGDLTPNKIYGNGIGRFMTLLIGPENLPFAITFGAMALSTFIFDTIDVGTRLGRYLVQELFGWRGTAGAMLGTVLTLAPAAFFLVSAPAGAYRTFWTLFGASNQLLAALTLISVVVWLKQEGRPSRFVWIPLVFLLTITLWALTRLLIGSLAASKGFDAALMNAVASGVLIGLALFLVAAGVRRLRATSTTIRG